MRTDGEITKEEYNKKRAEYEAQIKNLRSQATAISPATPTTDTLDLDRIISELKEISDSKTEFGHEALEHIVSSVIPTSEGVYEWHLSTEADAETQTNLAVKGRANSKERPYPTVMLDTGFYVLWQLSRPKRQVASYPLKKGNSCAKMVTER